MLVYMRIAYLHAYLSPCMLTCMIVWEHACLHEHKLHICMQAYLHVCLEKVHAYPCMLVSGAYVHADLKAYLLTCTYADKLVFLR
jgi:hypothetical protein